MLAMDFPEFAVFYPFTRIATHRKTDRELGSCAEMWRPDCRLSTSSSHSLPHTMPLTFSTRYEEWNLQRLNLRMQRLLASGNLALSHTHHLKRITILLC